MERLGRGRPLVITDPRLLVRHANERLLMAREGKVVATMPVAGISHVAVHGPATLTGAAIARLLDAGIDVTFATTSGRFRGVLSSAASRGVFLLLAQVDAWQRPERRLEIVRALLTSKLVGQRALLRRHAVDHGAQRCREAADAVGRLMRRIPRTDDVDQLRGLEGAAAAAYFGAFGEMVGGAWTFEKRTRRPPTDPVNALLSYGYAIATGEITRRLLHAGFDTRIGLFHGLLYGRQSLALDLVEEFRCPMVDRFTLRLLRLRRLDGGCFEAGDDGAVLLSAEGRRRYLAMWDVMLRRPRQRAGHAGAGNTLAARRSPSWARRMDRQVERLRTSLLERAPYEPVLARGS